MSNDSLVARSNVIELARTIGRSLSPRDVGLTVTIPCSSSLHVGTIDYTNGSRNDLHLDRVNLNLIEARSKIGIQSRVAEQLERVKHNSPRILTVYNGQSSGRIHLDDESSNIALL